MSVLPLVERLIPEGSGLAGEPGVSYLTRAGGMRVLFDSGLSGGKPRSALVRNAAILGAGLGDLDAVVISHLHADHVGGLRAIAAGRSPSPPNRWSRAGCRPMYPPRCTIPAPISRSRPGRG